MLKKTLSLILALLCVCSLFSGCSMDTMVEDMSNMLGDIIPSGGQDVFQMPEVFPNSNANANDFTPISTTPVYDYTEPEPTYIATQAVVTEAPNDPSLLKHNSEGISAKVILDYTAVYTDKNPNASVLCKLSNGDQVTVSAFSHFGRVTLACVGNGWIDIDYLLFDGCAQAGTFPCTVLGKGLRYRTGPGESYTKKGEYQRGDKIFVTNLFNAESGNAAWVKLTTGYWVHADYITFPENTFVISGSNAGESKP